MWVKKHGLRYHAIYGYREVGGWLSEKEALALYDVAKSLADNCVIVEIGSFLGRSSVVLSQGIRGKKGAALFCIDPLDTKRDPLSGRVLRTGAEVGDTMETRFRENIMKHGVPQRITILRGYSYQHSPDWIKGIDLLFIDGNHSHDAVLRDYTKWAPFVKNGGFLAFHDVSFEAQAPFPGPGQVIKQHILDSTDWLIARHLASLFVVIRS